MAGGVGRAEAAIGSWSTPFDSVKWLVALLFLVYGCLMQQAGCCACFRTGRVLRSLVCCVVEEEVRLRNSRLRLVTTPVQVILCKRNAPIRCFTAPLF
jgi:hypothetical protein